MTGKAAAAPQAAPAAKTPQTALVAKAPPPKAMQRNHAGAQLADTLLAMTAAPGAALGGDLRGYFEPRLGGALGAVRVHSAVPAVAAAGAQAVAIGRHIGFAPGRFAPETAAGRALIGHELAHTLQQARGGGGGSRAAAEKEAEGGGRIGVGQPLGAAFALADYQNQYVTDTAIAQLSVTALGYDIDEIAAYVDRQIVGTAETDALYEVLGRLHARHDALLRTAMTDPPRPRRGRGRGRGPGPGRGAAPAIDPLAQGPIAIPRILAERTSMPTDDPVAVQHEVDLIVATLQHPLTSADDRRILRIELANLAPQYNQARAQDAADRHTALVQAQFANPSEGEGGLRQNVAVIETIYNDPSEPLAAFIFQGGQRIRIGRAQADNLRLGTQRAMQQALQRAADDSVSAMADYRSMVALNREFPIVSTISGWLGDNADPFEALAVANARLQLARSLAAAALAGGHLSLAIDPMFAASTQGRKMRMAAQAFRDGYIDGAETAVTGLTFIADAAFLIDGALLAVVAAPFVAGALGTGALGTGVLGFGANVVGTGLVVGTTTGAAGYGSAYLGTRLAGGSHAEASAAGWTEGSRRGREGAVAGGGGAATRFISAAPAAARFIAGAGSPGGVLARQAVVRLGATSTGNFVGTTGGSLMDGNDAKTAFTKGGRSALLSAPGVLLGAPLGNSPLAQTVVQTGVGAVVGYIDARSQGASNSEAMRGVALNLTTALVTSGAPGMRGLDARMEARGAAFRQWSINTARAGALGLQLSLAPMRGAAPADGRPVAAQVDGPVAGGALQAAGQTMAGSVRPPAPAPTATPARIPTPGEAAHETWVANTLANGMGVRPPPLPRPGLPPLVRGDFQRGLASMEAALAVYDEYRARAPWREVGLYRHGETGEYAVVVGQAGSVGVPEALGSGLIWDNVIHNHPNPENVLTFRNPAPQDLYGNIYARARRAGPVTTFIDHEFPEGGRQFTAATQHPDGRVVINRRRADGTMAKPLEFASDDEFRAYWSERTIYVEPPIPGAARDDPRFATYRDFMNSVPAALAQARSEAEARAEFGGQTATGVARPPPAPAVLTSPPVPPPALPVPPQALPPMLGPGPRPPLMLGPGRPAPAGPVVFADLGRELAMTPGAPGTGVVWSVTPGGTVFATPPVQGVPIHAPDGNLPPASYFEGRPRVPTLSGPLQPNFTPVDVLPGRGATSRTLNQVRQVRGPNGRGAAGEVHIAESSPCSVREVTLVLPAGATRRSDVLSPTTPGIVNHEVKNYQRYRGANSGPLEVEWSRFMQTEINRDAMIMHYHRQQPVWVFTDAPPSAALAAALRTAGIPFTVGSDRLAVP